MKKKEGKPTLYTKELGQRICDVVAISPYGLDKICEENSFFPAPATIYEWRKKHKEFQEEYARAKFQQADLLAEECLNIAYKCNKDNWMQARLLVDTHKWLVSKLLPKQYGDRLVLEEKKQEDEKSVEEVAALRKRLAEKNKKDY